jgi:hypothetical protein
MRNLGFGLVCLLVAGCSAPGGFEGSRGNSRQARSESNLKLELQAPEPARYHYETVTEYFDGGTRFLVLVPDAPP